MALTLYGNWNFYIVLWLSLRCLCICVALCLLAVDSPVTDQISRPYIRKCAVHLPPRGIIPSVNNPIYLSDYLLWLHCWSQLKSSMFALLVFTNTRLWVEHQQTTLKTVCDNFVLRSYVNLQQLDGLLGKTATHFVLLTHFTFCLTWKKKKQDQNNNSTANFGLYLPQTIYSGGKQLQL